MNNTKTLAIVAVLTAATLVVGLTFAATAAPLHLLISRRNQDTTMKKTRQEMAAEMETATQLP